MTAVAVRAIAVPAAWRRVAGVWALSRLVVAGAFALLALARPRGPLAPRTYHHALRLLSVWDGRWYARIAVDGYAFVPGRASDVAFFPGFPLVLRGFRAFGIGPAVAGPVVSLVALLVALVAFYELTARLFDEELALRAAAFAALTPLGFVYSMTYPAALVLALVALSALAAQERRWLAASVCAFAAGITRPEAVALVPPLAALAWAQRHGLSASARGYAVAAVCSAPAGVAAYAGYLWWSFGDPRAWSKAETSWGRSFRVAGPVALVRRFPHALHTHPWLVRDALAFGVYLVLAAFAVRAGAPRAWIASSAVVLVLPLFSGTIESEARFGLLALPVYWGLAYLARPGRVGLALQAASAALVVGCVLVLPWAWP